MSDNYNTPILSDFFLYKDGNGEVKVEIYIFDEMFGLAQGKIT